MAIQLAVQGKNNTRGSSLCLQVVALEEDMGPQSLFAGRVSSCVHDRPLFAQDV